MYPITTFWTGTETVLLSKGSHYGHLRNINDTVSKQMNILLAEGHWPDEKGPNTVISMLDNYLDRETISRLIFNSDNCPGQNKNRWLIWYTMHRIIAYNNKSIAWNFMIAGHRKSFTERCFGVLKSSLKKIEAYTPKKLQGKLDQKNFKANSFCKASNIEFYKWEKFLGRNNPTSIANALFWVWQRVS